MDIDDIYETEDIEDTDVIEDIEQEEKEREEPTPPPRVYKPFGSYEPHSLYRESLRREAAARESSKKAEKFKRATSIILLIAIFGGAAMGFGIGTGTAFALHYWIPRISSDTDELRDFTLSPRYVSADEHLAFHSFADVIEMVKPAVVGISVLRGIRGERIRRPDSVSAGTGMVFHETINAYYIATNAHVVAGGEVIHVSINGSPSITANIVGIDESTDIAVLSVTKFAAHNANVETVRLVTFGDSDMYRVGDVVVAIGNALGEGISSTHGIISAKGRTINIEGARYSVMQTSAAINHGNSGGPLVALTGEVIGMNTAKLRQTDVDGNVEGMGYSIPSNDMIPILQSLMRGERAVLGVRMLDSDVTGALIRDVVAGSAAEAAGILVGDIIIGFDERAINTSRDLVESIEDKRPGDVIILKIQRDEEIIEKIIFLR